MRRWRKRRRRVAVEPAPLTPAEVAALRDRADRAQTTMILSYILASIVGAIGMALVFTTAAGPGHQLLVAWTTSMAAILFVALGYAVTGRELPAVIVTMVVSWASFIVIVSQVSAALSSESYLFGTAVAAFVLVRRELPALRIGLASTSIATYILCELAWPDGSGTNELPAHIAHQLSVANKIGAGLMLVFALALVELRHAAMMRMLHGAARYGELRATTDELTGVFNRRPVIAQLAEWSERGRGNYAIALIDLDNFKTINDEFGHDCGDTIIQAVAQTLRAHFRDSDMVSRWGGDEFLVLMPGVRHAEVVPILERLRRAVALISKQCEDHEHTVTVSIGAAMGAIGQSPDECIAAADHALYRAKEEGRDRVVAVGLPLGVASRSHQVSEGQLVAGDADDDSMGALDR